MGIKYRMIILLTLVFLGQAVQAKTGHPPDTTSVQRGNVLYQSHCQSCHQKNGTGEPSIPWAVRAPDYSAAMPLNDTSHAWHHSDEQLANTILKGIPNSRMPAWETELDLQEVIDLVAYIKSLWGPRAIDCQGPKHMNCDYK